MSNVRVIEISSTSAKSFDEAITQGVMRATKILRNIQFAYVKDQQVEVEDGQIVGYRVRLLISFGVEAKSEALKTDSASDDTQPSPPKKKLNRR